MVMRIDSVVKIFCLIVAVNLPLIVKSQGDTVQHKVLLQTNKGDIVLLLYNDTPKHRDNFLKLVKEGYYNGILFHRVIENFMIQCGDSTTRHALRGSRVGEYAPNYTLPSEIVFPRHFHKKGVLAAARESDDVNPNYESSSTHFYIVYGKVFDDLSLDKIQNQIKKKLRRDFVFPLEVRNIYKTVGGTPHLDAQYTVYGEVLSGLPVLEKIQKVSTDLYDRPKEDVVIIKAEILK